MPILKGSQKALRKSQKNKLRNDHFKDLYREARVSFEKAVKAKDKDLAVSLLQNVKAEGKTSKSGLQSIIDKLVKKNIIHRNNGARKKAKFAKMLSQIDV